MTQLKILEPLLIPGLLLLHYEDYFILGVIISRYCLARWNQYSNSQDFSLYMSPGEKCSVPAITAE